MSDDSWDQAIGRLADLVDLVEDALETGDWDHLVGPLDLPALPPLHTAPDAATVARAHLVLEEAARVAQILTARRDAVAHELAAGGDRRTAANRYAASGRLT